MMYCESSWPDQNGTIGHTYYWLYEQKLSVLLFTIKSTFLFKLKKVISQEQLSNTTSAGGSSFSPSTSSGKRVKLWKCQSVIKSSMCVREGKCRLHCIAGNREGLGSCRCMASKLEEERGDVGLFLWAGFCWSSWCEVGLVVTLPCLAHGNLSDVCWGGCWALMPINNKTGKAKNNFLYSLLIFCSLLFLIKPSPWDISYNLKGGESILVLVSVLGRRNLFIKESMAILKKFL